MKKTVIIIAGIVVIFIVVLAIVSGGEGNEALENGEVKTKVQTAADFNKLSSLEFQDYEGNTVTLASFKGKPMVINSWAAWCPFCVQELPDFATAQEEFSAKGGSASGGGEVVIITINRAESLEIAKRFSENLGVTNRLVMLMDSGDSFYRSIGGFSMPETIFVDIDGNIKIHKRGPMDEEEIRNKVSEAFGI